MLERRRAQAVPSVLNIVKAVKTKTIRVFSPAKTAQREEDVAQKTIKLAEKRQKYIDYAIAWASNSTNSNLKYTFV